MKRLIRWQCYRRRYRDLLREQRDRGFPVYAETEQHFRAQARLYAGYPVADVIK